MVIDRIWTLLKWRIEQIQLIWWLLLSCMIIIAMFVLLKNRRSISFKKLLCWCVLLIYLFFIVAITVLSREQLPANYEKVIIDISTAWTIGPGVYGAIDTYAELFMNIFMFVPIGYLLSEITNRQMMVVSVVCFVISLAIELLQLLTGRGFFELADIILYMVGACIGYGIMSFMRYRADRKEGTSANS